MFGRATWASMLALAARSQAVPAINPMPIHDASYFRQSFQKRDPGGMYLERQSSTRQKSRWDRQSKVKPPMNGARERARRVRQMERDDRAMERRLRSMRDQFWPAG